MGLHLLRRQGRRLRRLPGLFRPRAGFEISRLRDDSPSSCSENVGLRSRAVVGFRRLVSESSGVTMLKYGVNDIRLFEAISGF